MKLGLSGYGWIAVVALSFGGPIGCASPEAKSIAADAAYSAQLLACVDQAKTLAESKACRAVVDTKWGLIQTTADAGREAQ